MALDPRIRAELERRGPANIRELLRIRTGPGDRDPVALQLAGVPDPPRSEVEDWLREREREGETVTGDTLKWAKIAGRAAVIGVVITAVVGIVGIVIGVRSCSYSSSNYNEQNRPILATVNYSADANDFIVWTLYNRGNEDATDIHFQFAGIESDKKSATLLKPESPSIWPRLIKFGINQGEIRIQVSRAKFSYLLVCIDFTSERGQHFRAEDDFYEVASWAAGVSLSTAPRPNLSEGDKLRADFSCGKL